MENLSKVIFTSLSHLRGCLYGEKTSWQSEGLS